MPDTEEEIKSSHQINLCIISSAPSYDATTQIHQRLLVEWSAAGWGGGGKGNLCEGLIQGCSVSFKIWGSYHSHPSVSKKYPPPIYNYKG